MGKWERHAPEEARRLLMEELREKRDIARNGKKKRVGSGRVRVRMSCDGLDRRGWAQQDGRLRVYQLGRPMGFLEFRRLPEDVQRLYVKLLRDKHGATRRDVRRLVGEDFGMHFGAGDAEKWRAFLARERR